MERYHRYKIETGKSIFVKNADDFLEKQGNNWYFCKCKEGIKQACLGSVFGITEIKFFGINSLKIYQKHILYEFLHSRDITLLR